MADDNQVRKQMILRTAGSPLVLAPFIVGMTALTGAWALDWKTGGIALFVGLAGLLGSAGAFVTRLLLGGEKMASSITTELEQTALEDRQAQLDALERELVQSDRDPRPEQALRDLRELVKVFDEVSEDSNSVHLHAVVDVRARVNALFEHCVHLLEQTIKLWTTAQRLSTPSAQKPILDQREKIVAEIQASVKQLSNALIGLQHLSAGETSTERLNQMRQELDQSLQVAQTVEERVKKLMSGSDFKIEHPITDTKTPDKG